MPELAGHDVPAGTKLSIRSGFAEFELPVAVNAFELEDVKVALDPGLSA